MSTFALALPRIVVTLVLATTCFTSIVDKLQDFNIYFSDHTYKFITNTVTRLREDIFNNNVLSDS